MPCRQRRGNLGEKLSAKQMNPFLRGTYFVSPYLSGEYVVHSESFNISSTEACNFKRKSPQKVTLLATA